jgi:glyoxylase-like metal-dependent hydrolase (beta-lactamase superfamily II)
MTLQLKKLVVGSYQSNCYLLEDTTSGTGVLVDAGDEAEALLQWVADVKVTQILITHGHADHVGALGEVRRALGCPVGMHLLDAEAFQLDLDFTLEQGTRIGLGPSHLEVHAIPGHTPGSVAFAIWDDTFRRAIVGDAIFPGGPGYTTSPLELRQSLDSLERTVFTWADSVELYPGHGVSTTVGAEREAFETFRAKPLSPDLYGDVLWR